MRIGFIGTGVITAHIVRGLQVPQAADWQITVSPRSAEIAAALALLPGVQIAPDNQAVIVAADVVVLAVRPQIAEQVLRPLRFDAEQPVISLMAGISLTDLAAWTGARDICRAIPLPSVERRTCVTPVYPPSPAAMQIFALLGQALPVSDLPAFDAYATGSAMMATWFGFAETVVDWMQENGIPPEDAATYVQGLFGNLGDTLRSSSRPIPDLRQDHATRGGLNEQAFDVFTAQGGTAAIKAGMGAVMARITGRK